MPSALPLPLVTIVTPSYNQGRFIAATIESVLSQDYPNLEYIIVDGDSNDETADVVARFAGRLTFVSERDRGQSDAINKGFKLARGSIVAWLNSDDIFLPGAIRKAVAALQRSPDVGAVYGEGYQIDVDGNIIGRFAPTQKFDLWRLIYLSDYILQQTVFFRRSVFDKVGLLDESLYYGMDWEILMRIGLHYRIEYIPEYMGAIREHESAKTFGGGRKRIRELLKVMRRHGGHPYPPGYFVYGISAFREPWVQRVGRLMAGPLASYSQRVRNRLDNVLVRSIGWFVRHSQGLYSDGWASPKARFVLPPSRGRLLEARVSLPAWAPIKRQVVDFKIKGKTIAREAFESGDFTIPLAIPRKLWNTPLFFTLETKKFFRAQPDANGQRDSRRMCYLINSLDFRAER